MTTEPRSAWPAVWLFIAVIAGVAWIWQHHLEARVQHADLDNQRTVIEREEERRDRMAAHIEDLLDCSQGPARRVVTESVNVTCLGEGQAPSGTAL